MWGGKSIHFFRPFNTAFQAAVALGSWEGKRQGGEEAGREGREEEVEGGRPVIKWKGIIMEGR